MLHATVYYFKHCWARADETPRRQSWWTKLWGRVVWMASGYQPTMYSYQNSLPHLPVPSLTQTIDRFLLSMEPLYGADSEQFTKLHTSAQVVTVFVAFVSNWLQHMISIQVTLLNCILQILPVVPYTPEFHSLKLFWVFKMFCTLKQHRPYFVGGAIQT